ncbi:hypothetical protein F4678DRAFT_448320 [Xylaria arbuscula]|nr:hypothetical protein F4678DRAFT_448320 [Xylaria arbuscula]
MHHHTLIKQINNQNKTLKLKRGKAAMNNFGVIELASTKTTSAPGWAYVPDRQPHHIPPSTTAASTTNRKRSRAAASGAGAQLSLADANARQDAKARREIEILDRDNARDVHIAIPAKSRAGGGGAAGVKKYTPNVRKIMQSQKTFANHLDDYIALAQQAESNPAASSTTNTNTATNTNTNANRGSSSSTPAASTSRSGQRQASISVSTATATASRRASTRHQQEEAEDVEMPDIPPSETQPTTESKTEQTCRSQILTPHPQAPPHAEDSNPLLASRLPPLPSDDELRALLAAPPLSYLEVRGVWREEEQQRYPTRAFCAVCGYWGRVRCMKCGTRVCALECLETHQEECITRYGI